MKKNKFFQYINIERDLDNKLRPWEDQEILRIYENTAWCNWDGVEPKTLKRAIEIKDEERSRLQKRV